MITFCLVPTASGDADSEANGRGCHLQRGATAVVETPLATGELGVADPEPGPCGGA